MTIIKNAFKEGRTKTTVWDASQAKHDEAVLVELLNKAPKFKNPIECIDPSGKLHVFNTTTDAAAWLGVNITRISQAIRTMMKVKGHSLSYISPKTLISKQKTSAKEADGKMV